MLREAEEVQLRTGMQMVNISSFKTLPSLWGKMDSSSSWASIQSIKYSTYFGAETSMGFFICTPSAHLYSYLKLFFPLEKLLLKANEICSSTSFLPWSCSHCRATFRCAEFCECAIEQIDLVEEVHSLNTK